MTGLCDMPEDFLVKSSKHITLESPYKTIPGSTAGIGRIWKMMTNTCSIVFNGFFSFFDRTLHNQPLYQVDLPGKKMICLNDEKFLSLFYNEARNGDSETSFGNGPILKGLSEVFGPESLFTASENIHRLLKEYAAPHFNALKANSFIPIFERRAREMCSNWADCNTEIELTEEIGRYVHLALSEAFIGSEYLGNQDLSKAINNISKIFFPVLIGLVPPRLAKWYCGYEKSKRAIEQLINNIKTQPGSKDKFIPAFIHAKTETGQSKFSNTQIIDMIKTLFIAGQETTTSLILSILWQLSQHPIIFAKLLEEIDNQFQSSEESITSEKIQSLKYLNRIYQECLRLMTPAFSQVREVQNDIECEGYLFPKGSTLLIMHHARNRDTNRWGADAEKFNPERERGSARALPFGRGRHSCLGQPTAYKEVLTAIITIARQLQITSVSGGGDQYPLFVTTFEKPLKMGFEKRISQVATHVFASSTK